MSLSRDSLNERILKAIRRAEFSLNQRIQRIRWEESVLLPEIADLKANKSVLGLPENVAFDIEIVDENPNHPKTSDGQ